MEEARKLREQRFLQQKEAERLLQEEADKKAEEERKRKAEEERVAAERAAAELKQKMEEERMARSQLLTRRLEDRLGVNIPVAESAAMLTPCPPEEAAANANIPPQYLFRILGPAGQPVRCQDIRLLIHIYKLLGEEYMKRSIGASNVSRMLRWAEAVFPGRGTRPLYAQRDLYIRLAPHLFPIVPLTQAETLKRWQDNGAAVLEAFAPLIGVEQVYQYLATGSNAVILPDELFHQWLTKRLENDYIRVKIPVGQVFSSSFQKEVPKFVTMLVRRVSSTPAYVTLEDSAGDNRTFPLKDLQLLPVQKWVGVMLESADVRNPRIAYAAARYIDPIHAPPGAIIVPYHIYRQVLGPTPSTLETRDMFVTPLIFPTAVKATLIPLSRDAETITALPGAQQEISRLLTQRLVLSEGDLVIFPTSLFGIESESSPLIPFRATEIYAYVKRPGSATYYGVERVGVASVDESDLIVDFREPAPTAPLLASNFLQTEWKGPDVPLLGWTDTQVLPGATPAPAESIEAFLHRHGVSPFVHEKFPLEQGAYERSYLRFSPATDDELRHWKEFFTSNASQQQYGNSLSQMENSRIVVDPLRQPIKGIHLGSVDGSRKETIWRWSPIEGWWYEVTLGKSPPMSDDEFLSTIFKELNPSFYAVADQDGVPTRYPLFTTTAPSPTPPSPTLKRKEPEVPLPSPPPAPFTFKAPPTPVLSPHARFTFKMPQTPPPPQQAPSSAPSPPFTFKMPPQAPSPPFTFKMPPQAPSSAPSPPFLFKLPQAPSSAPSLQQAPSSAPSPQQPPSSAPSPQQPLSSFGSPARTSAPIAPETKRKLLDIYDETEASVEATAAALKGEGVRTQDVWAFLARNLDYWMEEGQFPFELSALDQKIANHWTAITQSE